MSVPNTILLYTIDGVATRFPVTFEYLARKFVAVTLVGEDREPLRLVNDYVFENSTTIRTLLTYGPADGYTHIEVRRVTSATERLVNFTDATVLRASDLNVAELQSLHIAEEARDTSADVLRLDDNGNLDLRGRRIVNLRDPVGPTDAVNLQSMNREYDGIFQAAATALQVANGVDAKATTAESNSILAVAVSAAAKSLAETADARSIEAMDLYRSVFVADYAAARSLVGPAVSIYVAGVGSNGRMSGHYTLDSTDTTTADDGGLCLVVGGKRYKRAYVGGVYADWYGVFPGDISRDSRPGFEAARLAIMAMPRGGILKASPGHYFLSSSLSFPNTDGKSVILDMYGVILSRMAGVTVSVISAGSMTEIGGGSFSVKGLTIGGNYLEVASASVALSWAGSCSFRDVSIISGGAGITMANCFAFRGDNLRFQYCNGYGIRSDTICHNMQLTNCSWNSCFQADVSIGGKAHNLKFSGGDHEGGVAAYVFEVGGSACTIIGEYIEGMTGLSIFSGTPMVGFVMRDTWLGYNAAQTWYNFNGGLLDNCEFYDQQQTIDPSSLDMEVAKCSFSGSSNVIRSAWADVVLNSGYTATGAPYSSPGYRKDRSGRVAMRGSVSGATDGVAFTLPVGYRPVATLTIPLQTGGAATGRATVQASGQVVLYMLGTGSIDLAGVSFEV